EKVATRARAYQGHVRVREFSFDNFKDYHTWRRQARASVRQALQRREFFLWVTGNHLGVLPVYDELSGPARCDTLALQFDAHLDIYNLSDCTAELSHGNFLLHADGPLPSLINVGARELLLRPDYIARYYQQVFSAADLAIDIDSALTKVAATARQAR